MKILVTAAVLLAAQDPALQEIAVYERDAWARTITLCDEVAAHPDDPERVANGVSRADMNVEAAISACRNALEADPDNPRLNYQLARAYGYAGRHDEGEAYRLQALRAGYPQSLFVYGYIRLTGWDGRAADACYGGALIHRSAQAGRFAGLVGFPHYVLDGQFEGCEGLQVDTAEMLGFLDEAEDQTTDFYRLALITQLRARLTELEAK